jgi:predicted TIM-barrel fold metal-dependent hydrolase
MDRLIVVSSDSHAQMPPELWPTYLDERYHELLPRLYEENEIYPRAMWLLTAGVLTRPDVEFEHREGGYRGVRDAPVRLEQMDRDGIAAELVYIGDFRSTDPFCNIVNGVYPLDAWDAGVRAYHRWLNDEFGAHTDRLLLTGAIGSCTDMEATLAELDWIADHGFVGTFVPGFVSHPGMAPLSDASWEPFWARCEQRGLALVVHAGFGWEAGVVYPEVERIYKQAQASGASDLELVMMLATDIFNENFFADVKPRRPMWQLMFSGVFDRHPDLKLVLTEVRADWLPATLEHLDALWEEHHAVLPAKRKPSEYWLANCLAGASFVHRAEVEMREEIGVETFLFGRDYPHPEGTWPNTRAWLRDAFAGVPDGDLRLMLGENAIRFFGLDRDRLAVIADKIGPTIAEITGGPLETDPELRAHFDLRGGYLKPAERGRNLALVDSMIQEDLAKVGAK